MRTAREKRWAKIFADLDRLRELRKETDEALEEMRRGQAELNRLLGLPVDEELSHRA